MSKFNQYFLDQSKLLTALGEGAANIDHRGSIGSSREGFIKNFLEKTFPKKFIIGSGEIFDSLSVSSGQCDVVVYDESMPVLDYAGPQQFLAEGVFSHIEVKSNLTSSELKNALEITKSVKELERKIDAFMHTGDIPTKVFSCIFAYQGISLDTAKATLETFYKDENNIENKIDAICVLNEYIVAKFKNKEGVTELFYLKTGADTLALFFIELYASMYKNWMGYPDLAKYIDNESFAGFYTQQS
jgi:hypothetical protein